MSAACVRLSPPQRISTITAPCCLKYTRYPGPWSIRISLTLEPTGLTSPALPTDSRSRRAAIRILACRSRRVESHASKTFDLMVRIDGEGVYATDGIFVNYG